MSARRIGRQPPQIGGISRTPHPPAAWPSWLLLEDVPIGIRGPILVDGQLQAFELEGVGVYTYPSRFGAGSICMRLALCYATTDG
jgi:hypothetical protein